MQKLKINTPYIIPYIGNMNTKYGHFKFKNMTATFSWTRNMLVQICSMECPITKALWRNLFNLSGETTVLGFERRCPVHLEVRFFTLSVPEQYFHSIRFSTSDMQGTFCRDCSQPGSLAMICVWAVARAISCIIK